MKFLDKINLNYVLLFPLVILCFRWFLDGKYLAFILAMVFAFVLYAVLEEKAEIEKDETGEEE